MSQLSKSSDTSVLNRLRAAGCRITPPRQAVLKIFEAGPHHLSPDEVLTKARKLHPGVGRATVYRTLDLLTRLGITRPLPGRDGRTSFTHIEHGHQHVVCSKCDRVVELSAAGFAALARRVTRQTGFKIQSQLLEFYGLCQRCQK